MDKKYVDATGINDLINKLASVANVLSGQLKTINETLDDLKQRVTDIENSSIEVNQTLWDQN